MARRPPPLPPPPPVVEPIDPDQARATEKLPPLDWSETWDDSRKTTRIPADVHRKLVTEALGYLPPRPAPADSIPIHEVPETVPPPQPAPFPMQPIRWASPDPRRAPVERAAIRLAWVIVGCTVVVAMAILAAAWGR